MEHSSKWNTHQNGTLILSKRNSYSSWNGHTHINDLLKTCLPLKLFLTTSPCLFLDSRITPVPKIGLWTFLRGFPSPWAHDPFFTLASGFPFQITWLPVAWAHDPFYPLVSGFEPTIPLAAHGQRLHFRLATTRTNQKPVWGPSGPTLLLEWSFFKKPVKSSANNHNFISFVPTVIPWMSLLLR